MRAAGAGNSWIQQPFARPVNALVRLARERRHACARTESRNANPSRMRPEIALRGPRGTLQPANPDRRGGGMAWQSPREQGSSPRRRREGGLCALVAANSFARLPNRL